MMNDKKEERMQTLFRYLFGGMPAWLAVLFACFMLSLPVAIVILSILAMLGIVE
jgi:hypothetical protein